jgi:wobble nucleotide-excising tRNase
MLTKIVIEGPASFKKRVALETGKKVNLIYGLNGTGKSTICKILRDPQNQAYANCEIHGGEGKKIFVFNEDFIQEKFYESDGIKGIFSLSKENKEAEEKLAHATRACSELLTEKQKIATSFEVRGAQLDKEIDAVVDKAFDIKRKHSGGDRVLEFCLEGVMGKKESLFTRLANVSKPTEQPNDSIQRLQADARLLAKGAMQDREPKVPTIGLQLAESETNGVLVKAIVGSHNSNFTDFINQLKISDWVKQGRALLTLESEPPLICPFCQHRTVGNDVIEELNAYFDKTYEDQVTELSIFADKYREQASLLPALDVYKKCIFYDSTLDVSYAKLDAQLKNNLARIREKVATPSLSVTLESTEQAILEINETADRMNKAVEAHNGRIANISQARKDIERRFWSLMRWDYDQSVAFHAALQLQITELNNEKNEKLADIDQSIRGFDLEIIEAQKQTINIDGAITKINSELVNVGILDFSIKRHGDHLYRLDRPDSSDNSFKSLSEGERIIIALLYFCEVCAGRESADDVSLERVVVLDDPISSMSHIFVFNVGRLLLTRFFLSEAVSQVYVFTHSLYFFYELTDTNHDRREESQALFRITKNANGSAIAPMKYEEIQNDYQAYWQIINDDSQHPALIANCMRNVIEYFFGFVEKKAFNNVFQKAELQQNKFQAFSRYMNRESHSFGQNVFDVKEFDYQAFREGLKLVFDAAGYEKHYKQMAKI